MVYRIITAQGGTTFLWRHMPINNGVTGPPPLLKEYFDILGHVLKRCLAEGQMRRVIPLLCIYAKYEA